MTEKDQKIAVLIDADNVSDKYINTFLTKYPIMEPRQLNAYMAIGQTESWIMENNTSRLFDYTDSTI